MLLSEKRRCFLDGHQPMKQTCFSQLPISNFN
jgi:hypothetical protein